MHPQVSAPEQTVNINLFLCSGVGISRAHFRIGEGGHIGTKTDWEGRVICNDYGCWPAKVGRTSYSGMVCCRNGAKRVE